MSKKRKKGKSSLFNKFMIFFVIIAVASSIFSIYEILLLSSIETLIRYIVIGVLVLLDLIIIFKCHRIRKFDETKNKKKPKKKLFMFLIILYTIICLLIGGTIFYVYDKINGLNKTFVTYTSDLLVMSTNQANDISDVKDMKIGILKDDTNPEGAIIPKEIIKENNLNDENEVTDYDNYTSMLVDLYSGDLDAMFISNHYVSMFSGITGYENIENETKVIAKKSKKMRKASSSAVETASTGKSITEPFTMLLMGIDSTDEVLEQNAIANGDTLILLTFNPKTLNATMFSIPRDSYVPIACWSGKPENKITHAAAYGNDCMINTIQDYFDVNIDYYAKINFKGLVKLVDAVGGVEVDVPKVLCTDDSSRGEEICIQPGHQTLNGEQALVYARNRKQLANGDFGRAEHQQEIIMALINKIKTINDVSTFIDILNTVSNSMDTNLTTKQILSFYNVGKDILKKSVSTDTSNLINVQRLYLQGTGQMIYDERARMVLWDYVPNKSSRKDIIQAMKENLELADHKVIKKFSFSINNPYEVKVIGEGPYNTSNGSYNLVPDFTGDTEAQARAAAAKLGLSVTFKGSGGRVISQSFPANKRTDLVKGNIVLTLSGSESTSSDTKKDTTTKTDDKKTDNNKNNNNISDNNNSSTKDDKDDNNKDNTGADGDNNNGNEKPSTGEEKAE